MTTGSDAFIEWLGEPEPSPGADYWARPGEYADLDKTPRERFAESLSPAPDTRTLEEVRTDVVEKYRLHPKDAELLESCPTAEQIEKVGARLDVAGGPKRMKPDAMQGRGGEPVYSAEYARQEAIENFQRRVDRALGRDLWEPL